MVRPKKGDTPDLGDSHELTAGLIERLACLADKQQAFIRDRDTKGLRVRVTAAGAKSYVFEKKLTRQTIRRTIGDVSNWSIEAARIEARRLAVMLDNGQDPRAIELQQQADNAIATAAAHAVTVGEAWSRYTAERRLFWGALTIREHKVLGQAGGIQRDRHPGCADQSRAAG